MHTAQRSTAQVSLNTIREIVIHILKQHHEVTIKSTLLKNKDKISFRDYL